MREQVCEHLLKNVEIELPRNSPPRRSPGRSNGSAWSLPTAGGMSPEQIESRLAAMRAETEAESLDRLKLNFILQHLAQHFEVQVTEQEVNGRIAQMAAQRGARPEQLRNELVQSGQVGMIAGQIREHKAADRVIDQAEVQDVPAEEWNAMARESGEAKGKRLLPRRRPPRRRPRRRRRPPRRRRRSKCSRSNSSAAGGLFSDVAPWLAALVGLVVVGFLLMAWIRRTVNDPSSPAQQAFTLQDLRDMRDSGELSEEEFERARAGMIGSLKATPENGDEAPPQKPDNPHD